MKVPSPPASSARRGPPRAPLRRVLSRVAEALLTSRAAPPGPQDPCAPVRSVVDPRDIYLA